MSLEAVAFGCSSRRMNSRASTARPLERGYCEPAVGNQRPCLYIAYGISSELIHVYVKVAGLFSCPHSGAGISLVWSECRELIHRYLSYEKWKLSIAVFVDTTQATVPPLVCFLTCLYSLSPPSSSPPFFALGKEPPTNS